MNKRVFIKKKLTVRSLTWTYSQQSENMGARQKKTYERLLQNSGRPSAAASGGSQTQQGRHPDSRIEVHQRPP